MQLTAVLGVVPLLVVLLLDPPPQPVTVAVSNSMARSALRGVSIIYCAIAAADGRLLRLFEALFA